MFDCNCGFGGPRKSINSPPVGNGSLQKNDIPSSYKPIFIDTTKIKLNTISQKESTHTANYSTFDSQYDLETVQYLFKLSLKRVASLLQGNQIDFKYMGGLDIFKDYFRGFQGLSKSAQLNAIWQSIRAKQDYYPTNLDESGNNKYICYQVFMTFALIHEVSDFRSRNRFNVNFTEKKTLQGKLCFTVEFKIDEIVLISIEQSDETVISVIELFLDESGRFEDSYPTIPQMMMLEQLNIIEKTIENCKTIKSLFGELRNLRILSLNNKLLSNKRCELIPLINGICLVNEDNNKLNIKYNKDINLIDLGVVLIREWYCNNDLANVVKQKLESKESFEDLITKLNKEIMIKRKTAFQKEDSQNLAHRQYNYSEPILCSTYQVDSDLHVLHASRSLRSEDLFKASQTNVMVKVNQSIREEDSLTYCLTIIEWYQHEWKISDLRKAQEELRVKITAAVENIGSYTMEIEQLITEHNGHGEFTKVYAYLTSDRSKIFIEDQNLPESQQISILVVIPKANIHNSKKLTIATTGKSSRLEFVQERNIYI